MLNIVRILMTGCCGDTWERSMSSCGRLSSFGDDEWPPFDSGFVYVGNRKLIYLYISYSHSNFGGPVVTAPTSEL